MKTLVASLLFWILPVYAQDYPAREIRSICNFAAGSGADIIVRYYSDQLAKLAGKPVIVENRPGAQGAVASAEKDGASIGERLTVACGSKASMWVGSTV